MRVVAAAILHEGKVLAARRASGAYAGGWEFPGGKIEEGETPEEALVREISEELDCDLRDLCLLCTVDHDYPEFHLTMDVFVCQLAHHTLPHALEHDGLIWLGRDELGDVEWLPADQKVVRVLSGAWDNLVNAEAPESRDV